MATLKTSDSVPIRETNDKCTWNRNDGFTNQKSVDFSITVIVYKAFFRLCLIFLMKFIVKLLRIYFIQCAEFIKRWKRLFFSMREDFLQGICNKNVLEWKTWSHPVLNGIVLRQNQWIVFTVAVLLSRVWNSSLSKSLFIHTHCGFSFQQKLCIGVYGNIDYASPDPKPTGAHFFSPSFTIPAFYFSRDPQPQTTDLTISLNQQVTSWKASVVSWTVIIILSIQQFCHFSETIFAMQVELRKQRFPSVWKCVLHVYFGIVVSCSKWGWRVQKLSSF